jgi:nicotinamidase/pyrazinamidase
MNALIMVDVQNDFCPGGALPVPEGDQIVPLINRLQPHFGHVVATRDWHPLDHKSFAANHPGRQTGEVIALDGLQQVLWPVHCVQNTPGAEFHPALDRTRIAHIVRKGEDPAVDSYSGFFDNGRRKATGLADHLRSQGATSLYVCGLATDYCVKFTALDAVELGFRTHLVVDACRGVNLAAGDAERAIAEMAARGIEIIDSAAIFE